MEGAVVSQGSFAVRPSRPDTLVIGITGADDDGDDGDGEEEEEEPPIGTTSMMPL